MQFSNEEVVWVTGSSTGIGRATSLAFARHGCRLIVHYNKNESQAQEVVDQIVSLGGEALLVQGDVASASDVQRMVHEIEEHYGHLDVLVNNAGSLIKREKLVDMSEELWDRVMDVNLKSVILCFQAVMPLMQRRGKGKIINLSSVAARNGGGGGAVAYATAKAGVANLTRGMAKEVVSDNILVNAVAPGVISTPFHDQFTPPERREQMTKEIPLGREGTPEEVAEVIVFLASPSADYLVGETIEVNGGQLMS